MNGGEVLLVIALASILVLALFFVFCRRYEDGIFGNLSLCGMAGACAVAIQDTVNGELEVPPPMYCLLILCCAIFMARHAFRFALFHWHGRFGWRRPADRVAAGARTGALIIAIAAGSILAGSGSGHAATIAVAHVAGAAIALTDEPCQLAAVVNLPMRAIWTQNGRVHEGCFGAIGGVIAAYFDDRTVAVMPGHIFTKAAGT